MSLPPEVVKRIFETVLLREAWDSLNRLEGGLRPLNLAPSEDVLELRDALDRAIKKRPPVV